MKTKTWKVITNTGKQADLESGLEKQEVQKPTHISARDFIHWLAVESRFDDDSLRSLFKFVRLLKSMRAVAIKKGSRASGDRSTGIGSAASHAVLVCSTRVISENG